MSDPSQQSKTTDAQPAPTPQAPKKAAAGASLGWLHRKLSPLVVFAALGSLAFWGHHTGWTMPKFSSLVGRDDDEHDNWCGEHNVPESECVECNPDLLPKGQAFGWCGRHGVHECPLCHPEIAQIKGQPQVTPAELARAEQTEVGGRALNNRECKLHERRIQFASLEAVEKAGIEVQPVETAPLVESVLANGEITYDQTRTARLSARVPGNMFRVYKQVGDPVKQGDVIALVDAVEVGRAKSELLQALVDVRWKSKSLERLLPLARSAEIPELKLREIESALSGARIRLAAAQQSLINLGLPVEIGRLETVPETQLVDCLRFLGLPQRLADTFDVTTTSNLLPVVAPLDGVVVARDVVAGEVVDSAKVLFVVADVRTMWLVLDLRLEDAKQVAIGQTVRFDPDGCQEASGRIAWISTEADHKTRTVKVRVPVENGDGRLRANVFGTGRVILREASHVVVPSAAVQWEGCCHVVFVRDKDFLEDGGPKIFHVRSVRVGAKDEKQTEIVAGVLPGEVVAARGSSLLRAELLKENLGEGCACCKK